MEINAVVSENARRLREEKRLTLDEASFIVADLLSLNN